LHGFQRIEDPSYHVVLSGEQLLWATKVGTLGDYEALREMGGWSSWEAMRHYVSAGAERRRKIAEQF